MRRKHWALALLRSDWARCGALNSLRDASATLLEVADSVNAPFAGLARQLLRLLSYLTTSSGELLGPSMGIVATPINRLRHFNDLVRQRSRCYAHSSSHQQPLLPHAIAGPCCDAAWLPIQQGSHS
eukprot:GHUV01058102.1.p1 GENE.GHUV01058102.1~~GHUV01058102.1.p1  ORF type:complete len:126 (-),score=14.71 GHUV01058102.1:50-427(-)